MLFFSDVHVYSLMLILTSEAIYGSHNFNAVKEEKCKKYVILGHFVYFLFFHQVSLIKSGICTQFFCQMCEKVEKCDPYMTLRR
jgi:hypothetical protein